jgi:hypothetical protein
LAKRERLREDVQVARDRFPTGAATESPMRRSLWVFVLFAAAAFDARAIDSVEPALKLRAMVSASAYAYTAAPSRSQAPFTAYDPLPAMLPRGEQERHVAEAVNCQHSAKDLCYDLADRRVVYRPIRQYMPKFEGLTPESVSLRRDRILVRYSFR